jgi:hypothetical protein
VRSIGGAYKLALYRTKDGLVDLAEEIPIKYAIVDGDHFGTERFNGSLTKLSLKQAEVRLANPIPDMGNIEICLVGTDGKEIPGALHGKVSGVTTDDGKNFSLQLTSMSPEIETFLRSRLEKPSRTPPMPLVSDSESTETTRSIH